MPNTRLLTRTEVGYEPAETPNSVTSPAPGETMLNQAGAPEASKDEAAQRPITGQPQDLNPLPAEMKTEGAQMGYENMQPMVPLQPAFMPQMNHPAGLNSPHGVMNHPNMQLPPLNHPAPGFPMMGFPVFQPNLNMNEFAYVPPMRFPGKELAGGDGVTPQAVLGRLSSPPMHPPAFPQSSFLGPPAHYSQFFDPKDQTDANIAFLEYSGGVVFDNGPFSHGGRWLVFWEYKGRIWRKSFQITMFGNEGAKELAENFWVSKMRAIQLFNRNRQEKMVKEHKRVDGRGRKKKAQPQALAPQLALDPTLAAQYRLHDLGAQAAPEPVAHRYAKQPEEEDEEEPELPTQKSREQRSESIEHEGLTWDKEAGVWAFEKIQDNQLTVFRLKCESREQGLREAEALKTEYEYQLLNEYIDTGLKGVLYDRAKMNWKVVYWVTSKGVKRFKTFSVTKLGYRDAKEAALAFKRAVDESGGEEPDDVVPDPLPPEELFADPIVAHFHKVLSSIAVRQVKDGLS